MATVRDLITDSLFAIGALGQSETLTDADAQLCLRRLIRMVGSLANEHLTVYTTAEDTFTMTAGTASYATTLLTVSGRPVSVQNLFLRLSNVDYPVEPINEQQYDAFAYKPAAGLPSYFLFDTTFPNGTFFFYPTPSAAYVAHVKGRYPLLASTITLATTLSLPLGYEAMLCDNLAVNIASSFGVQAPPELVDAARKSKAWLKTNNYVPMLMDSTLSNSSYVPGHIRILAG